MGGKRKPDPETQSKLLKNVSSLSLHVLWDVVEFKYDDMNGNGAFKRLSKQEKEQELTTHFNQMVMDNAEQTYGRHELNYVKGSYRARQQILQKKADAKKVTNPEAPSI